MSKWAIAWSFLGLVLSGCGGSATALRSDNVRLQTKVNQLRAQVRSDRNKKRDLENQVFLLRDKMEQEKHETADAAEPPLPVEVLTPDQAPPSDAGYQVVGVDDEGNQIVYVGDAASDRTVSPRLDKYLDDDTRSSRTPVRSGPPIVDPGADAASDRLRVTASVPTVASQMRHARRRSIEIDGARALYQRQYAALRAGDHASAIAGFRAFLQQYPHSDYADNAQYWLGEAFYDQRQYKLAMREFRRVINNYPRGNKVPDALLKIGFCYAALGETSKARDVLEQVTRVYPASNPGKLAQRRLAELAGGK